MNRNTSQIEISKHGQFSAGSLTHCKLHAALHVFSVVNGAPLSPLEIQKKTKGKPQ